MKNKKVDDTASIALSIAVIALLFLIIKIIIEKLF